MKPQVWVCFDSGKNAYKVRVVGSDKVLWLIKDNVVAK
jgi:hypothetical protein